MNEGNKSSMRYEEKDRGSTASDITYMHTVTEVCHHVSTEVPLSIEHHDVCGTNRFQLDSMLGRFVLSTHMLVESSRMFSNGALLQSQLVLLRTLRTPDNFNNP